MNTQCIFEYTNVKQYVMIQGLNKTFLSSIKLTLKSDHVHKVQDIPQT